DFYCCSYRSGSTWIF
nr:immunoglobulin light chain junction region [Macaca mulatta]